MIMEEDMRVMKKQVPKKHLWKPEEDLILKNYVETHGEGNWATVSKQSGLMRGGKSCRLRWKNYLRPNIKRGGMSKEEQDLIIRMHKLLGNRWSLIAGRLPGRTDNEVKNYWNTHLNKRCQRKEITKSDTKKSETKSKKNRTEDSDPIIIISESHQSTTGDKAEERKEEGDGTTTLLSSAAAEPVVCFNHNMESPIMADHGSLLFFDDEPFTNYMDSFMFLGAFGCPISGENYAQIGMQ